MDPRKNPYSPGAGTPPKELAGRDAIIEKANVALDRIRDGNPARSLIFYGLRGVGKTVLMSQIRRDAEAKGAFSVWIEAPENRSLPASLAPPLRAALLRISRTKAVQRYAERALVALAGFIKGVKVKYGDIEVGLDVAAEPGFADSGDLTADLGDLLKAAGEAARACKTAIIIYIDELQYVEETQLGALISALHSASQAQLPIVLMAAGLPQLLAMTGRAKSYSERLFEFVRVDRLDKEAARKALVIPAEKNGVRFEEPAVLEMIEQTKGYPYFLQEWGKHSWDIAATTPITEEDAKSATISALAELDASFFRVHFDQLTPAQKQYMRAMAELGFGPHRSGDIADKLKRKLTSVAPIRNALIAKGMLYSPAHGDTAFTVPLFDGFMKRIIPEYEPD
jgi:hypothetical protein